MHRIL